MQALARRWALWMDTPYPSGWGGVNIAGCELVLIDADMAMLVKSAVERGPLTQGGAAELARLLDQLRGALPSITGEGAAYFGGLTDMADIAVRLANAAVGR